ncbi:hypothetical protein MPLSOD_60002 [Mesorhizobium sp. SOD10]|nr:hypothetical protein MPLSOD_60002 [Mesorhizobium sp. SOD10]
MSLSFRHVSLPSGVQLKVLRRRLLGTQVVETSLWPHLTGKEGAAARYLLALADSGEADISATEVLVVHPAIAALPASVAEAVRLPPLGTLSVTLAFQGIMTDPRARIRVSWYDADTRRIRIERTGALARWGALEGRLSGPLYALTEAIDRYNATESSGSDIRIAAWAPVQNALKMTTGQEVSTEDRFLTSLTIYQAGAVALDVFATPYGPDFLPVVMGREKSATLNDDAPAPEGTEHAPAAPDLVSDALLPEPLQRRFASELFAAESTSRDAYVLDRNTYLVVDPALKSALDVIRTKRSAPREERISFLQNPRIEIARALGDETGEMAQTLLVETWQYSERILGLGVWEPPAMPWLKNKAGQWLPERFPVRIGDQIVEMDQRIFDGLKTAVAAADQQGDSKIQLGDRAFKVPEVQEAFERLGLDRQGNAPTQAVEEGNQLEQPQRDPHAGEQERLIIQQNFEGKEFAVSHNARQTVAGDEFPPTEVVTTRPKPHQKDGFDWLVGSYKAGWPGVLLADDMGLGKTFQALAFLVWVRQIRSKLGIDAGSQKKPMLIVAPTALLRNWVEEADRHLAPQALGERIDAFGSALRHLKMERLEHWTAETALDVARLRSADWILTTYETLADYHRAFARVPFSVAVFDEAQKIKSPGSINTQSAKAMNVEFALALTGTPIENRLADLWCIMDRVVPGYLGDLKGFVQSYEKGGGDDLRRLKASLDQPPRPETPPVLLRRMKAEILEGLPKREVSKRLMQMPPEQAEAYAAAVFRAQTGGTSQGDMLRAIHAFRGISLHPAGSSGCDPLDMTSVRDWIAKSARMVHAVKVLEHLNTIGEKALVFVEDLEVQKVFAAAIATHLQMPRQPAIINGTVPGEKRLEIVERFQSSSSRFDLLVLSPKAAGIGLTITAANHVIHLSRWWNPAVEDQCNDRCYRIGQQRPVTVHVPIAVHPEFGETSFDQTLDALLERKRQLSRDMLVPPVEDGDVEALFGRTLGRV